MNDVSTLNKRVNVLWIFMIDVYNWFIIQFLIIAEYNTINYKTKSSK